MGLLAKILRAVPREEQGGIHLDPTKPFWEVSGKTDFPSLLRTLPGLLPEGCVLYFEGGSPSGELQIFFRRHCVLERAHVQYGTIWPKPRVFHIPATREAMERLSHLSESCASPELAEHFHVYRDRSVLLEWHDVFTQPMLLAGHFSEEAVRTFTESLHMSFKPGLAASNPAGQ